MTYPHANTLNEGPNVSHRKSQIQWKAVLWGAVVTVLSVAALYATVVMP